MKVASNKISDIKKFMHEYLKKKYPAEEINSFFYILLKHYCNIDKNSILSQNISTLNESELLLVYDAIKELETYKPIQYILGETEFYGLKLRVNPSVLIPRPETEELVDMIIKENKNRSGLKILDIGTGSGCIAIALKKHLNNCHVTAIDISTEALETATLNSKINQTEINFLCLDILDKKQWHKLGSYDIVVSNPPYVTASEKSIMRENVLNFEPGIALFVPDNNPLKFYKAIFELINLWEHESTIYCEINSSKSSALMNLSNTYNFAEKKIIKDIQGKNRFFKGKTSH